MISLNGSKVFCMNCASHEMTLMEDELLSSCAGSEHKEVLRCERCHQFFSKEFVKENFMLFTDRDMFQEIMFRKKLAFDMRRAFEDKMREIPKAPKKRKTKNKSFPDQKNLIG